MDWQNECMSKPKLANESHYYRQAEGRYQEPQPVSEAKRLEEELTVVTGKRVEWRREIWDQGGMKWQT